MEEEWKIIEGFENYQVSSEGRIKSFVRKERILKNIIKHGYSYVGIIKDGKQYKFRVHRLVAKAFIPNSENLKIVNHKNRNKSDNRVDNLEWCSQDYNMVHKFDNLYNDEKLFNQMCPKCQKLILNASHRDF